MVEMNLVAAGRSCLGKGSRTVFFAGSVHLLLFTCRGDGTIIIEGKEFRVDEGVVFLAASGGAVSCRAGEEGDWEFVFLGYEGVCSGEDEALAGFVGECCQRKVFCGGILERLVSDILAGDVRGGSEQVRRNCRLHQIWGALAEDFDGGEEPRKSEKDCTGIKEQEMMRQAAGYMEEHMADRIRIEELAHRWGMGRGVFSGKFTRVVGESPRDYLVRVRMEKAGELLSGTQMQVHQVAALVGYADALAFSKIFRAKYGVGPRDFRKQRKSIAVGEKM